MTDSLTVQDRTDIQDLIVRYAWALDVDNPDGVVALFAEDGVFDGVGGYYSGPAGIRDMAARSRAHDAPHLLQHWVANSLYSFEDGFWTVRSMCFGPSLVDGQPQIGFVGSYLDRVVKAEQRWLFRYRRWRPWTGEPI